MYGPVAAGEARFGNIRQAEAGVCVSCLYSSGGAELLEKGQIYFRTGSSLASTDVEGRQGRPI